MDRGEIRFVHQLSVQGDGVFRFFLPKTTPKEFHRGNTWRTMRFAAKPGLFVENMSRYRARQRAQLRQIVRYRRLRSGLDIKTVKNLGRRFEVVQPGLD